MLVEFRVRNFKNFKEELVFRFGQIKNYEFSLTAIRSEIVKTSLVYGRNGSGKSNLGLAILDISNNLNDKKIDEKYNESSFINLVSRGNAIFYYKFKFNSSYLVYRYEKDNPNHILNEEVLIDDERMIYYDHVNHTGEVYLEGAETLNIDLNEMSFVKYIKNNSDLLESERSFVFEQFIEFVDNMLLFSSLCSNDLIRDEDSISRKIIERGKLKDFESFLKKVGIKYKLIEEKVDDKKLIFSDFNGVKINFLSIASNGTLSLTLFYYWLLDLDKVSLVFIDEFDVFYHNDLARFVVQEVLKSKVQAIITTHNTSIMDNDLLRPDCYFNLVNGRIESFANSTFKELRKAHNLEKMYRAGSFDE